METAIKCFLKSNTFYELEYRFLKCKSDILMIYHFDDNGITSHLLLSPKLEYVDILKCQIKFFSSAMHKTVLIFNTGKRFSQPTKTFNQKIVPVELNILYSIQHQH